MKSSDECVRTCVVLLCILLQARLIFAKYEVLMVNVHALGTSNGIVASLAQHGGRGVLEFNIDERRILLFKPFSTAFQKNSFSRLKFTNKD